MKKLLSFLLALILMLGLALPSSAATAKAAVMRLELVEGSVTIKDASGVAIPYSEDMRLYSGYSVDTGDDSYAYISLDDSKAIKLGMNTSVVVKKSWRKLKVELKAGQLIFNVTTPLASDEALEIRTSTMITGVRGSSGGMNAETGEVFYATGHGIFWSRETDQTSSLYGLSQRTELWGGRIVSVNWPVKDMELSDFPALFLGEVAENPDLQNSLKMEGRFDPQDMINLLPLILEAEIAAREEAKSSAVPLPESAADSPVNGDNVNPAFNNNWDLPTIVTPPPIIDLDDFIIPDDPMNPDEPDTTAYTVTWQDEDGTILEIDENVPVGTVPEFNGSDPIKTADAQYTYTFAGWDSIPAAVTGDAIYTATYSTTTNTYTITWKDENGAVLETDKNVAFGSYPSFDAETPTKAADAQYTYTFAGWSPKLSDVTGNETYTATYSTTTNTYTITWKDENGTVLETDKNVAFGSYPSFDAETPAKAANAQYTYTFADWSPKLSDVTGNETYTATYTETLNKYTITWKVGNEVKELDENVPYGSFPSYDGEEPTKDPTDEYTYAFQDWTPAITDETTVTGNETYTAVFVESYRHFTVTWMVDGESSPVDYEYGSTVTPPADPTKTGYTFAGWYDGDQLYAPTDELPEVTKNVTYTAQWNISKYTVTFVDEDGSEIDSREYNHGTVAADIVEPDEPTKDATAQYTYTFDGWTPAIADVTDDATYTATYSSAVNKYTVTWLNYDNSELEKDEDVPYGDTPSYNDETPTKPEDSEYTYVFKEWTPAVSSVSGDATYTATFTTRSKVTVTLTEGVESITIGEDTFTTTGNYDVPYNEALLVSYTLEDGYADGPTTALMVGDSAVSEGTNAKDGGTTEIPGGSEVKVANLYKYITALNDTQVTMNSIIKDDVDLSDSFTLNFDLIITEDGALTITEAGDLTLAAGHTITNNGTITIYATLTNYGTITNEDAIIVKDIGVLTNCSEDTLNNKGSIYLFGTLYNGSGSYQGKVINSAGAKLIGPGTFLSSDSSSLVNDGLLLYEDDGSFGITSGNGTLAIGGFCGTSSSQTREVLDASPYWYLTGSTGSYNLTISGNGAMGSYDSYDEVPWYGYAEEILSAEIESGITNIGNHAFYGCIELKSISIPDSVATIGDSAFNGCIALGADAGPGLDTAFVIPDTITSIGTSAFRNCGFMAVVISTDSIGANAFSGCESLVTAYFQSVPPTTFSNTVFDGCDAGFRIVYKVENRSEWRDDANYDYSDPDNHTYYGYHAQAGYKVTFDLNLEDGMDVAEIEPIRVNANSVPELPESLVDNSNEYEFIGWYKDSSGNQFFKPDTPITDDITLYARWRKILEGADP